MKVIVKSFLTSILRLNLILAIVLFLASCEDGRNRKARRMNILQPEASYQPKLKTDQRFKNNLDLAIGNIVIPLERFANPEVYRGEVTVDLERLTTALSKEMSLRRNGRLVPYQLIRISRPDFHYSDRLWYEYPHTVNGKLGKELVRRLIAELKPGDRLGIRLSAEDSLQVQSAVIRIIDPKASYEPPIALPMAVRSEKVYSFQLIQEARQGPVLKIDTADVHNQEILALYRKSKHYKIIHVPGFATRRRLINEENELVAKRAIRRTEYLAYDFDWYQLSEYNDYPNRKVILHWGALEARPETEILAWQQLIENMDQPLRLFLDKEELKIKGIQVLTVGKAHQPALFLTSGPAYGSLRKALLRLPAGSSVYIDKIIIENEKGRELIFPLTFAFHFGEKIAEINKL